VVSKKRKAEYMLDYDLFLKELYALPPPELSKVKIKKKQPKKVTKLSVNKGKI
jgi:hypothetical protein